MYREKNIKEDLYKPFDNVDSRPGRGGTYDYIKWQHVADRMNQVFGTYWTSEVVSEHILNDENDVVLRIRIMVADPETRETFSQEGYGGATVRQGEDVGTAFKSAYSKGIKDACKKWGIGLYLTEDGGDSNTSRGSHNAPQPQGLYSPPAQQPAAIQPAPVQSPPVQGIPATPMPVDPAPIVQPSPVQQAPVQQPAAIPQPVANVGMPPAPVAPIASGPTPVAQPAPVQQSAPVEQPVAQQQDTSNDPGSATAVQTLAISNMAKMHGANTEEEVLSMIINTDVAGLGRQVSSLSDLTYNEAVKIIRTVKELQDKK